MMRVKPLGETVSHVQEKIRAPTTSADQHSPGFKAAPMSCGMQYVKSIWMNPFI